MSYEHTQHGKLHWILHIAAIGMFALAWGLRDQTGAAIIVAVSAAVMLLVTLAFHHLTVRHDSDALSVRFGPLPLLGKRIPYADMRSAKRGRSRLIDGLGVHWSPGRGWIYNLWGFDCVEIELKKGRVRVGTDDPDGLVAFLNTRISH